jgi:hypothetical protein
MTKNRHEPSSIASKYLNDIEYTGTTYKRPIKAEHDDDDVQITKTSYCPRPNPASNKENKPSFFGSLFTRGSKQQQPIEPSKSDDVDNPYQYLSQIRGGNLRTRLLNTEKPAVNEKPNLRPASLPTKEPNFVSHLLFNRLVPFVSHLGLQLSRILPYLVIIIFTVIILQYVRMKVLTSNSAASSSSKSSSKFAPLTDTIEIDGINRHNFCDDIKDTECWSTKILVRELIDFLRLKSGLIECSSLSAKSDLETTKDKSVHLNKIKHYLFSERRLISSRLHDQIALDSVISAVAKNPSWGLRLLNSSYDDTAEPSKVTYLMSIVSSKSISCRLKELLHFVYVRVIMFGSLIMVGALLYFIYKAYRSHQLAQDRVFYELVSKATSLVEKQFELSSADPNAKPFIAIAHIYDSIMDPSRRQSSKKLWTRVVKFIEDHESRIHLETQFIDGEETHVWKWIVAKQPELNASSSAGKQQLNRSDGIGLANSTMITPDFGGGAERAQMTQDSSSVHNTNKSAPPSPVSAQSNCNNNSNNGWQGDAFNRSEKLSHSPTPCLKIRNMFDSALMSSDPSLAARIHNDILLKCCSVAGSEAKIQNSAILHISCDRKSKEGCVYVKCTTNETAGRVYQALSGVWYSGRLLNVKFLRSDRYLERFPDSAKFIKPLQLI